MVFLNLHKYYDNLNHGRLMQTLGGYEAGPKMRGILESFWSPHEVVTLQNGYHGPQFRVTRGTTQGGLISPTIFNLAFDSVVQPCLYMTLEDDTFIQDGFGHAVGWSLWVSYADDYILGSRKTACFQGPLMSLLYCFSELV